MKGADRAGASPYLSAMNRRSLLAFLALASLPAFAQESRPLISPRDAHERAKAGQLVLVDIRTPEEWRDTGVPEGAIRLDLTNPAFEARLAALRAENPGKPIALVCRTASRSRRAQEALLARGWRDVLDVSGGVLGDGRNKGWLDEGLPVGR